jgi:IclR family pca regulon transcriptional regulator
LSVICAFDASHPALTLSAVASRTGLTRAAARRFLLTLEDLGYVACDSNRCFSLRPRVLELGNHYLSALSLPEIATPHLKQLAAATDTSSSMGVIDGLDLVYVAREKSMRILRAHFSVGSRFPAANTSMGRAILSGLPQEELDEFLARVELHPYTEKTITSVDRLRAEIDLVRTQGYAWLDQELEIGVRGLAVLLRDRNGRPIAAINITAPDPYEPAYTVIDLLIGPLRQHAAEIERDIHAAGLNGYAPPIVK